MSCVAAAWIFILDGCRSGKYSSIAIGYAFILITVLYKAQIFVASAFLALMYPCLFFRGAAARLRGIVAIVFVVVFVVAVWLSQRSDAGPVLRLDFSAAGAYAAELIASYDPGFFKSFFAAHILPKGPKIVAGFYAAGMILVSSFGLWGVAFGGMIASLWKKKQLAILFFPMLLVANYLIMAVGIAADTNAIGTWDELLNRPIVWAYFGMVVWTAGAAYALAFGDNLPQSGRSRSLLGLATLSCFAVPWFFARDLQTFPSQDGFGSFSQFSRFPSCLVSASYYIGGHSRSDDVIQDSANDQNFLVGALSGRQDFAVGTMLGRRPKGLEQRLESLVSIKSMPSEADLLSFAVKNKIAWYLLRPETTVSWPLEFRERFAFDCGGYRVYNLRLQS